MPNHYLSVATLSDIDDVKASDIATHIKNSVILCDFARFCRQNYQKIGFASSEFLGNFINASLDKYKNCDEITVEYDNLDVLYTRNRDGQLFMTIYSEIDSNGLCFNLSVDGFNGYDFSGENGSVLFDSLNEKFDNALTHWDNSLNFYKQAHTDTSLLY